MRAVAASVYLSEENVSPPQHKSADDDGAAVTNGSKEERMLGVVQDLTVQLCEHRRRCGEDYDGCDGDQFLNPVQGPDRPRLILYLREDNAETLVLLLKLVAACCRCRNQEAGGSAAEVASLAAEVAALCGKTVADQEARLSDANEGQSIIRREEHFESLVNILEVRENSFCRSAKSQLLANSVLQSFSFACILCGVCRTLLKPTTTRKGRKKKKDANPEVVREVLAVGMRKECLFSTCRPH